MTPTDVYKRPRVLVCGTTFGQFYLEAFRVPDFPFELVGIFGKGSERSHACAVKYGVPLYTSLEQLPAIDIACVVIRAGIVGGNGTELAKALMLRKIHVLQEHPLHHDELAEGLRTARSSGVNFRVNFFYSNLESVRKFIAISQSLLKQQKLLYIDAACSFQVAYALFDIIGKIIGSLRPWGFAKTTSFPTNYQKNNEFGIPFRSLEGIIGNIPTTLRIQNQMNPTDPDNFAHIFHRITIGTEGGNLTLFNTHGPIIWTPRLYVPIKTAQVDQFDNLKDEHLNFASSTILEDTGNLPSWRTILSRAWPAGIRHELKNFWTAIIKKEDPLQQGQYHLAICQLAQEVSSHLGPPELIRCQPPEIFSAERLISALENEKIV